jgi:DNA-binding CsgD family transcriptional regulator
VEHRMAINTRCPQLGKDVQVVPLHNGVGVPNAEPLTSWRNQRDAWRRASNTIGERGEIGRALDVLGDSPSLPALAGRFIDVVPTVVGADVIGVYVLEPAGTAQVFAKGTSDAAVRNYELVGRPIDFLLATILRTRMPVHDAVLLSEDAWHRHDLYLTAARAFPLDHCLLAPIQVRGEVVGTLNLGRRAGRPAFDNLDLLKMATLAGQFAATHRQFLQESSSMTAAFERLPARAREIAILAAKGLSNPHISKLLGITPDGVKQSLRRTFRKLDVSCRVELATELASLI